MNPDGCNINIKGAGGSWSHCPALCHAKHCDLRPRCPSSGSSTCVRAHTHTHTLILAKPVSFPGELRGRGGGSSALVWLRGETWLWPPLAFFPLLAWGGAGAAEGLLLRQGWPSWCQGACPLPCLSPSPELPCPSPQRAPCFHFPHPATPPLNSLLPPMPPVAVFPSLSFSPTHMPKPRACSISGAAADAAVLWLCCGLDLESDGYFFTAAICCVEIVGVSCHIQSQMSRAPKLRDIWIKGLFFFFFFISD